MGCPSGHRYRCVDCGEPPRGYELERAVRLALDHPTTRRVLHEQGEGYTLSDFIIGAALIEVVRDALGSVNK